MPDLQDYIDELEARITSLEAEVERLRKLKCDIGTALGDDAGPPFAETVSALRARCSALTHFLEEAVSDTHVQGCDCAVCVLLAEPPKEEQDA